MDWNELLRKFKKHNPTRTRKYLWLLSRWVERSRRGDTLQIASFALKELIFSLSLHLTVTAQTASVDQLIHSLLFSHSSSTSPPPAPSLSPSSLPPLPPILPSSSRPALLTALEALQAQSQNGTKVEVENARVVLGFGSYAVGQFEGSLRALEGKGAAGSVEESYDWTLRVLGNAVRGTFT